MKTLSIPVLAALMLVSASSHSSAGEPSALPGKPESACRKGIAQTQYVRACPYRQTTSHFGGTCSKKNAPQIQATSANTEIIIRHLKLRLTAYQHTQ